MLAACAKGCTNLITSLLASGSDPNSQNESGVTPLMIAAQNGHIKMVRFLLNKGAKPNLKRKVRKC